jgi:2-polyprenyl-6-methoxyphenol hydroxylase-like FAD-dependent oxidoreductase
VRRLAFGPESKFHSFLGYYVAGWDIPNYLNVGRTALYFNAPGKLASVVSDPRDRTKASTFFVFASKQLDYDRHDMNQQKQILADTFDGIRWEVPNLIQTLWDAPELYFDSISRIDVDHLSKGRVVLLGDAGYSATLGGMGTGMAIVGAYVLAGELAAAKGNHSVAFARYEEEIRDYAKVCQKGGRRTGLYLAPPTSTKLRIRNWTLNSRLFMNMMMKQGEKISNNITLRNYSG